jgi:hypothetical protein
MKTEELIKNLATDLPLTVGATRTRVSPLVALGSRWAVAALLLFGGIATTLPVRPDWAEHRQSLLFRLETLLWVFAVFAATAIVYQSGIPSRLKSRTLRLGLIPFAALMGLALARGGFEFEREWDLYRGRCGPLIMVIGVAMAVPLILWARSAAVTRLRVTAAWIALAAGSAGGLAMQFVCGHDEAVHLLVWHFMPVAAMTWVSVGLSKKYLSW